MRRPLLVALAVVLTFIASACDELGNPDVARRHTPAASWTDGLTQLETRTFTVPPARSNELLRAIEPAQLHHADFFAPPGGVVTLVVVDPELAFAPRPGAIPLITVFRLEDGSLVRRQWSAPRLAPRYYAGFGLPAAPVEAVTAIEG